MLAGLLAGLCAVGFAKVAAEPQIAKAEQFERLRTAQEGKAPEHVLVARDIQDTVGLGVGVALSGVALGGVFGLAFASVYRRFSQARAKTTAFVLAGAAFVTVFLVPFVKYPANPPSVGNPDTIAKRTATYFVLIAVGLLALVVAMSVQRLGERRLGNWNATVLACAAFVAIIAVAYLAMPTFTEVPAGFPASVLWNFRVASVGSQLTLWATLGLVFGQLTERQESAADRARVV